MHSVLLNQLATIAVLFSIPKLLDERTRPTVRNVVAYVCLWCSRIMQCQASIGVHLTCRLHVCLSVVVTMCKRVLHQVFHLN